MAASRRKKKTEESFFVRSTMQALFLSLAMLATIALYELAFDDRREPSALLLEVVVNQQKISDLDGGFTETLDDDDDFGIGVAGIGDLDGDGVPDAAVGAWFDDDGGADLGAMYILFLNADGTVKSSQKISSTEGGFGGTLTVGDLAQAIGPIGDLDGDGVDDIAMGERARDDGGTNTGGVWILFMNTNGTVKSEQLISDTSGGLAGTVLDPMDLFGGNITNAGDLDGDLIDDLVVSATNDDDGGMDRGALHILYMDTDGTVQSNAKISDTAGSFTGTLEDSDRFGTTLAVVGDLDGDGNDDWVTSAPRDDDGGTDRGALYVLFMDSDETVKSFQKISSTEGNFNADLDDDDRFGSSVRNIGDYNKDGIEDLIVGAWRDDDGGTDRGSFYIIMLKADGTVKEWRKVSDTAGGFNGGLSDSDIFGFQISPLGDLDGNGVTDIIAGAPFDDTGGSSRGAAYVIFMKSFLFTSPKTPTAPKNASFTINNGEACTTSSTVTLSLAAEDAHEVVVSNVASFDGAKWEVYEEPSPMFKAWDLPDEDGTYTVYAIYRNRDKNQSSLLSQTIVLDQAGQCGELDELACSQNCSQLRHQFYLEDPIGGEVNSEGPMVRVQNLENGRQRFYFEDRVDFDFNDLVLETDQDRCGVWSLTVDEVNAQWNHRIGVRVFYADELVSEEILFESSQEAIGKTVSLDSELYYPVCQ